MKFDRIFSPAWQAFFYSLVCLWVGCCPAAAQVPYARAGWQAPLSTVAHGVRGTVTILTENSYRVDHFFYDGAGITVYFYLGVSELRADLLAGLSTGPNLFGTAYSGGSVTITLPVGKTFDDYRAISVWCTAVGVSFGSGTFVSPRENWRNTYFANGNNTGIAADDFDFDNDGLSNLLEYATSTDPKVPNTTPWSPPVSALLPGNIFGLQFTFSYRPESRDIRYRVQSSSNLKAWTEVYFNDPQSGVLRVKDGMTSAEDSVTRTIQLRAPVPAAPLFWRLAVDAVP